MLTDERLRQIALSSGRRCSAFGTTYPDAERFARAAAREARREALEEAAKVCEGYGASMDNEYNRSMGDIARLGIDTAEECAAAIRALIDKEPRT